MTWDYVAGALTAALAVGGAALWRARLQGCERARLEALVNERTRELRTSEARFRGIFENAVEGIFQSSLEGRNLVANPAMARICGYDDPAQLQAALTDVETQFYVQPGRRREINAKLAREGALVGCESEIYRRDGSTIWVSENVRVVEEPETGRRVYLGSIVDVTQKRRAEAEIRAFQQRFALLVRPTPLAVVEFDTSARVTAWNPAAERMFGYPAAEAIGRPVQELLLDEDECAPFTAGWKECTAGGGHSAATRRVRTRDGRSILCECYSTALIDEAGALIGVASLALDVTEREEAQERLRTAMRAAETANRAKSAFLANMSHELRTPLNGILGFVRVMRRDPKTDPQFRERLAIVDSSGEHLLHLINEVLDLSKIEAGKMELHPGPCNLPALLMGLRDVFGPRAAEKGIGFRCEMDAATVPTLVRADEGRLRQVLTNLLDNGFKFTDRGAVELRVTNAGGNVLRFAVRDTGIGIAPDRHEEIFQPFHQLEVNRGGAQGTGLGLGISRRLVELMGGKLGLESAPSQGSTFSFGLELPPSAPPAGPPRVRPSITGYRGSPRRVLVVDDEPVNRAVARELFAQVGFQVGEAASGEECLERVARLAPGLILLDLRMAPWDGFETVRRLRQTEALGRVKILASSAGALSPAEQEFLVAHCDGFIPKPIDVDTLFDEVAALLGLDWTYGYAGHETVPAPVPPPDVVVDARALPPPEEIAALLALARQGDVVKLRARLQDRGNQGGADASFTKGLEALAARFQIGQIILTLQGAQTVLTQKR